MEEGDFERQKKVEAGREKFAAYKKKKSLNQSNEQKKKTKVDGEEEKAEEDGVTEAAGTVAHSSASVLYPDEEESRTVDAAALQHLQAKVKELEDILEGKDVALEVARQEAACAVEAECKEQLEECRKRLLEFQAGVEHRDNIIQQLSNSLKQAISSRDALQLKGEHLADEVALLQRQLQATSELVQGQKAQDFLTLQNKMLAVEGTVQKHLTLIEQLQRHLDEKEVVIRNKDAELEKKSQELTQHKTQSAAEVQQLMREIEEIHQRAAVGAILQQEHEKELAAQRAELEESFGLQLSQIKDEILSQCNQEKASLTAKHREELETLAKKVEGDVFGELELYKRQVEDLNQQLFEASSAQESLSSELSSYRGQIEANSAHKAELASYEQQLESLINEHKLCKSKFEELELYRQSCAMEVNALQEQVNSLNIELQKVSEIAKSHLLKLEDSKIVYETELMALKQTHEAELEILNEQLISVQTQKWQVDQLNKQLHEKARTEEALKCELQAVQQELLVLKQTNEMQSYMQQLDVMNAELQAEGLSASAAKIEVQLEGKTPNSSEVESYKCRLLLLNTQLQEKAKIEEVLKNELKAAQDELAALKEAPDKQSFAFNPAMEEKKIDIEVCQQMQSYKMQLDTTNSKYQEKSKSEEALRNELSEARTELMKLRQSSEVNLYKQKLDILNTQLQERNKTEEKLKDELCLARDELKKLEVVLQERLKTEENLICKLGEHKQEIEILNSRVLELSLHANQISPLETKIEQLQNELQACKLYIHELEMIKEQVTDSSRIKEELINELSVSVKSLKEDDESYKQQLHTLHTRLDEESHIADENIMLRRSYESEISKYQEQIKTLNTRLQDTVKAEEEHLKEICARQSELNGYKMRLEALNNKFTEELTRVQLKYSEEISSNNQQLETLKQEASETKSELKKCKEQIESLSRKLQEASKRDEECNLKLLAYQKDIDTLNKQLEESNILQEKYKDEIASYVQQLDDLNLNFQENKERHSKELVSYKHTIDALESELLSHEEQIKSLNHSLECTRNALNTAETCSKEFQDKLSQAEEINRKIHQEKTDAEKDFNERIQNLIESHKNEVSVKIQKEEALQAEIDKLTLNHEDYLLKIEEYEKKIDQLYSELSEKDAVHDSKQKVLLDSQSRLHDTEEKMKLLQLRFHEEINSLNEKMAFAEESFRNDIEALKAKSSEEIAAVKEQEAALQTEVKQLSVIKLEHSRERSELKQELDQIQKLLLEKDSTIQTLEEQISNLKSELVCLEEEKKDLNVKLHKELQSFEKYEEVVTKLRVDLELVQEEKKHLDFELRKDLQTLHEAKIASEKCFLLDVETLSKEISAYKSQLVALQDAFKDLSSVHERCILEKEQLNQELTKLCTQLSEKDSVIKECDEQVTKYQSELLQTKSDTEHFITILKEEIENLKNNKNNIEKSYNAKIEILSSNHRRDIEAFMKQENVLREQLNELSSSYQSCQQEKNDLAKKLNEISSMLSEKDSEILKINERTSSLDAELLQVKGEMKNHAEKVHHEKLKTEELYTREIQKINEDFNQSVTSYKEREEVLLSQLRDLTVTHKKSLLVIEEYQKKLDDSNCLLAEQNATIENYSKQIRDCQMELDKKKEEIRLLDFNLHEELASVRNELENMKIACKTYEEVTAQSSKSKTSTRKQAPLADLEEMDDPALNKDLSHGSDIKDESELSLSERIQELETNLNELNDQCLKQSTLLNEKIETEKSLGNRIVELERILASRGINDDNANLSELPVHYLKVQSLTAGKEEVEQLLNNRIAELEKSSQDAIENLKRLKHENGQLSLKIVKAKELLKKLKAERDEARLKCKSLEEEQEQLTSEKLAAERLVEQLRTEIHNLQHKITLSVDPVSTLYSENQCAASLNSSEPNDFPSNDKGSGEDYSFQKLNATDDSSPLNLLKWMEQCSALEHEKKELMMECELLKTSLEERKIHERLFNEDMMAAQSRCEKLEKRLIELEKCESTIEKLIQVKVEMEVKLEKLESEKKVLEDIEASLSAQQAETKLEYEKKLQQCLQDQLLKGNSDEKIEALILELSCKSKDLIVVKERLTSSEYQVQKLNNKINALEKSNANVMKQFELFHDEVAKMRGRLEEAWQEHEGTEKELGHAHKELVLLQLRQSQLETSQSRLLDSSCDMSEQSILSLQREVHQMVEDLVAEVAALKQALQAERCRSEQLSCELKDSGLLELQQKLELVLQSNKELLSEKEVLMEKLQRGEPSSELEGVLDSQQNELMVQLAAYREQHTSLAELLGSAGILQETVRRQKEELMLKLQEKLEIEQSLVAERAVLKQTQLKLQLLEQQMIEKDNIQVELQRQKTVLEASLRDIEDRLRDQVDCLHSQKLELEAQIRSRDIHIRKCKLQVRAKEIEMDVGNLSQHNVNENADLNVKEGEEVSQKMLEVLRMELDEAHSKALARLRQHLNEQFTIRETVLQEKFTSELQTQHAVHQEQMAALQKELVAKTKQLESLAVSSLQNHLGVNGKHVEDMIALKEKHEYELENIRTGLEEGQVQLYALLKHKFESFAEQQISYTLNKLKEEHEHVLEMEVSALVKNHREELFALRARLENERLQELLEVRQELNKQHKEELESLKRDQKGEQPAPALVSAPLGVLSSHILLAHLKKFLYNEYICALKELSKAWKESWIEEEAGLNKLVEAMETNIPEPKVLQDSDNEQSDLMDKWEKMLVRAKELQQRKLAAHEEAMLHIEAHLDAVHSRIADRIKEIQQTASLAGLQSQVEQLAGERDKHRLAVELLSSDHTTEVEKMKELVKELERKHAKEMEELRQYFEQKVAEVEKHYSEEIVSQHSRRLSSSSCGSDNELVADIYYGSGDIGPRISTITHICDSYTVEPSYKDLEDHYRADFEKRLMEYRDQLESVKQELEKKYEGELLAVRNEYESKMERLVKELSSSHQAEIQNIEAKHIKEIENMKAKWRDELASLGVQNGEHSPLKKIPPSRPVGEQNYKIEGKPEVFEEELVWTIDAKQKALNSKARDCSDESKTLLDLEPERGAGDMKALEEMDASHHAELNRLKAIYEQLLQEKVEKVTQHLQCQEQEHLAALKKELEEKHAEELKKLQSLFVERSVDELGTKSAETALHIVQLEQALRQKIRHELEQELEQKVGEVTALIKSNAEQEQAQFIEAQNKMMKEFLECNRRELELVKAQAEGKQPTNDKNGFHASELLRVPVKMHKETQTFMTIPAERLLQDSELGSVSNIHKENQSAGMEVAPQLMVDTSALPVAERSQIQHDNIPVTEKNYVEKVIPVAEVSPVHSAIRRTEECAFKPETFLLQLSKVQDTHKCDLHALQTTWLDVLGSLVQGADPAKEMRRLKESFITDCASKFQVLLEQLRAIHESEIQEMEQIIQELKSNQELKESLHMREIAQLKATYASQLHADVEQAKHDIATALEEQIQALLAADETTPRPQELVLLKDKLVSPYIQQLKDVQEEHSHLVAQLKKEHEEIVAKFNVTQTSETTAKQPKVKTNEDIAEIIKERDQLKKMSATLRYIVEELMNYLVVCEDELNGTLLGDLGIEDSEPEMNKSPIEGKRIPGGEETNNAEPSQAVEVREESSINIVHKTAKQVRRVHFAPSNNVHLINLIDEENLLNHLEKEGDLPANFRSELEKCVERLKSEASALLGLAVSDNIETKQKKLTAFLQEELKLAKRRLAELESERTIREVVSEGFGEHIQSGLSHRLENLAQLQDKARTVMSKRSASPEDSPYLQLLEEICHEGDRLTEEARREREDLQQQVSLPTSPMTHSACCQKVDAADKQLRATRHFLEEQAAEREQERDEFLQEVNRLQEVLREREKELTEQQRIAKEPDLLVPLIKTFAEGEVASDSGLSATSEVEALELQGKEALALQQETIAQKEHLESELKEAVDKIWILREIITDLEGQVENKSKREAALEQQLQEMRNLLTEQTNTHQQLADELESVRSEMGAADLLRHVAHLEDQLMRHRQQMEQLQPDSTAVNQMKSQLRELETALEKRTKDLESLHVTPSSASCSSPSEDVSIREQMEVFRCTTPDEMRSSPVPTSSPAILPVEELQRLQDKLQRHSRAEEAALKRIRDLEMQLRAARRSEEEVAAERDVLQERTEEQLLKISSLQARVDQQRRKVETELTEEIAELQNKLQSQDKNLDKLQGLLELRDKEIKKLNSTIQRIKDALVAQEAEWSTKVAKEHEVVQQLQQQCHKLKDLYEKQKSAQSYPLEKSVSIPVLFETLLAEKNAEIDELQQKLQVQERNSAVSSSSKNYTVSQSDHVQSSAEEEDVLRHAENLSSELVPDSIGPIFQRTIASEKSSMVATSANSDVEDLRKELLKKESEIKYLKSLTLDRLNSFLREMEPLKDKQELLSPSLREDFHKLREQLQGTVSFFSGEDGKILHQEKELLTAQLCDLEKICQDKEQLLLQADVEKKEKDEIISNKQQEIDKLYKERDHLISQLRDHIELQAEEKAHHQEKEAVNVQQYDKQLENMVLLRKEIERLGKIVCEKDEIVQTLQQKLTDAIREKDTIVLSLKGELQDKISEKDGLVKSLQQELHNLSREHESKVKSLNKEKEQLHEQLRDLEETEQAGAELYRQMSEHLSATLREKEQAQAMVDALRTEVETELAAAEEQRVAANALRKEVESLKTKLAESEEQLHESTKVLKDEVKKLQEENSNLLADAGPIDDLTGKVQKELDLSARLDSTLLDHLSPLEDEDQPFKFPVPGSVNLTDILNKVMEFGMDALSFSELSFLHQETCTASSGVLKGSSAGGESEQMADSVSKNNEKELLQQITGLENQLALKEQEANERVNGLEVIVEQEKRHNTELQTALSAEQRRNGELHNRLGAQARLQADLEIEKDLLKQQLSYHEDRLKQLLTLLEQERLKVRKLEDDLQRERSNIKQLQSLLETERQRAKDMKLKDSELLESMRLKLEKVLDSEARLRFQVEQAKKEIPLTLSVPASQDNKDIGSSQEAVRHRLEVEQLRAEVALLRNHKESLEIQLTTAHNQLSSRQAEIDMMRRKVRSLQEAELRHQRRYATEREEIIEKARAQKLYFEQQLQDLKHRLAAHKVQQPQLASELEQLQQVHASVLQELAASKAREKELGEQLTKLREEEASPRVNEPFLEKLKNMNAALDQHVKDNNEVALTLARLVEERQVLHTRIRELEDRLTTVQANESASKAACATLVQEKAALQLALAQCKAEAATSQRSLAEDDMDSRVRHLFGKYLRAESYRKALAWQKRYLLVALGGYQETEATTLSRLAQLAGEPEGAHCQQHHRHRRSARTRFKSAAIVVVAIHRMRYLVQRWYHGRNIGGSTVLNRAYSESLFSGRSSYRGPRRHAGSAASAASSGSWGLPSSTLRGTTLLSPPSRDQPMLRRWQMDHSQQQWRSSETSPSPTYVQSNRLAEYVQRFDELQQRLGLAVVPSHQKT